MRTLLIINDPPYGTERAFNGLRLANSLAKRDGQEVKVYLLGDAASCAKSGQTLPQGYYSLERMLSTRSRRSMRSTRGWLRLRARLAVTSPSG